MTDIYGAIPFAILVALFVVVGVRDIVAFVRIGPGKSRRSVLLLGALVWVGGLAAIYWLWGPRSWGSLSDPFWTKILCFSLGLFLVMNLLGWLKRRGPGRVRAVAWTTFLEAMNQRAWVALPPAANVKFPVAENCCVLPAGSGFVTGGTAATVMVFN